jgi:hypothetical protein
MVKSIRYGAAALLGLADSGFQCQAYTLTGACFSAELKVHAFAVFGVLQHLGLTVAWVSVALWSPGTEGGVVFSLYWVLSGCCATTAVLGAREAVGRVRQRDQRLMVDEL